MKRFGFAGLVMIALLFVAPTASAQEGWPWSHMPAVNAAAAKPTGLAAPAPAADPEQGSRCVSFGGPNYSICIIASTAMSATAKPAGLAQSALATLGGPSVTLLASGLDGGMGSTIGPGGALYVTEPKTGRIWRVDPKTGARSLFADGLPKQIPAVGLGGAMDVAFVDDTAYALVTLVGSDVGGSDVVGIYRVDGPDSITNIADIGQFALDNPPITAFDVPTGVQYALETNRGGFLVTDGHHNRVLRVALDGAISSVIAFDNIVPTGLAVSGNTVYLAEAGPVPHAPADGKVVAFGLNSPQASEIGSGAPLLVDVEMGRGHQLYALSQGDYSGDPAGAPALPNSGALVAVNGDGTLTVITDGLDRPTSLEFIGNTAYVVTLTGEIWKIDDVSAPPFGKSQTDLTAAKPAGLAQTASAVTEEPFIPCGFGERLDPLALACQH